MHSCSKIVENVAIDVAVHDAEHEASLPRLQGPNVYQSKKCATLG